MVSVGESYRAGTASLEGKEAPSCQKLKFIFSSMCHFGEFLVGIRKKCGYGELERSLRLPLSESPIQEKKMSLMAEQEKMGISLPPLVEKLRN